LKKRFDLKANDLPLDSFIFFLDEPNTSPELITALKELGATVELHHDHFTPGTPDVVWLPQVARNGWIALTRDDAIRYVPLEKQALVNSQARVFILTRKNASGAQMAEDITQTAHKIKRFVKNKVKAHELSFVARIPRDGSVVDCKIGR